MNYINAGKLKKFLNNVADDTYISVGTRENNYIDEVELISLLIR